MPSKIETNVPRVILEVGPFGTPIYRSSKVVADEIERGALYIGIDKDRQYLLSVLYHSVVGNLTNLPVMDSSADEVWLMNVFGTIATSIDANSYFNELARIIKPNGSIYVGELFTPAKWVTQIDFSNFGLERKFIRGRRALDFI